MRLPGTEEWNERAVEDLIAFELGFAELEPDLRGVVRAADLNTETVAREFYVPEASFAVSRAG